MTGCSPRGAARISGQFFIFFAVYPGLVFHSECPLDGMAAVVVEEEEKKGEEGRGAAGGEERRVCPDEK